MLKLLHPLPNDSAYYIAVSGGMDSVAALHFLMAARRKPIALLYYNHNTGQYANDAEDFVCNLSEDLKIDFISHKLTSKTPSGISKEAFWREQRYKFFDKATKHEPAPIITAHTLDDCLEQYIMSTMIRIKEYPIIGYFGPSNTIRPFRTWKRKDIEHFFNKNNLKCIEDPSNKNTKFTRNYIRHNIIPHVLHLNPGIYKHVLSIIEQEITDG